MSRGLDGTEAGISGSPRAAPVDGPPSSRAASDDGAAANDTQNRGEQMSSDTGTGDETEEAPVPGQGDSGSERETFRGDTLPPGAEELQIGSPSSLFAEPGAAPEVIEDNLRDPAESPLPEGPARPPHQRIPAWIADLYD